MFCHMTLLTTKRPAYATIECKTPKVYKDVLTLVNAGTCYNDAEPLTYNANK